MTISTSTPATDFHFPKLSKASCAVVVLTTGLIAQDFLPPLARLVAVCLCVIAGGYIGSTWAGLGAAGAVPPLARAARSLASRAAADSDISLPAARPSHDDEIIDREGLVQALRAWGRDERTAKHLASHLANLGLFSPDGRYVNSAEPFTLDRALKIFDELIEEGVASTGAAGN